MQTTQILDCQCKHDWQDRQYGRGKRLHNKILNEKGIGPQWRCTVCQKER